MTKSHHNRVTAEIRFEILYWLRANKGQLEATPQTWRNIAKQIAKTPAKHTLTSRESVTSMMKQAGVNPALAIIAADTTEMGGMSKVHTRITKVIARMDEQDSRFDERIQTFARAVTENSANETRREENINSRFARYREAIDSLVKRVEQLEDAATRPKAFSPGAQRQFTQRDGS